MSSADGLDAPKRRNGKQQACEPCRKSKLRCDHLTPICGRCTRRNVPSQCKYLASPVKKRPTRPSISPCPASFNHIPKTNLPLHLQDSDGYEIFAAGSSYVEKCPNGFLGPTSYSAIFLEHQGKLGIELLDPCKSFHKGSNGPQLCHDISVPHNVSNHTPIAAAIRLGVDILNAIPSQKICEQLLDRYPVLGDVVSHAPTIRFAHQSFWSTYGSALKEPRDPAMLSVVSEELCRNAWSLLGANPPKGRQEWVSSFTGHCFRWEIVGVLLAMFGLSAMSLSDWDLLLTSQDENRSDRRKFACSMRDLVEACLLLCDHADNVSDLAVYLLNFSTSLQTYCETGKTSTQIPLNRL